MKKFSLIFLFLSLFVFLLSFLFLTYPPALSDLSPRFGKAGDLVSLKGSGFGEASTTSWISIGDRKVPEDSIKSWAEKEITFVLPDNFQSGFIRVITAEGRSDKLAISAASLVPDLKEAGPERYILQNCVADTWLPGFVAELEGEHLGEGLGKVQLRLGNKKISADDILSWNDSSIRFILPAWFSGQVLYLEDSEYTGNKLQLPEASGAVSYKESEKYKIHLTVELGDVEWSNPDLGGLISVYFPLFPDTSLQETYVLSNPHYIMGSRARIFSFSNPETDVSYKENLDIELTRYKKELSLDQDPGLEIPLELRASALVSATALVPEGEAPLKSFVAISGISRLSPLRQTLQILEKVSSEVRIDDTKGYSYASEVLSDQAASSFGFANLSVAALHRLNIPALLVEGWVLKKNQQERRFWLQALIPGLGWLEFDPYEVRAAKDASETLDLSEALLASAGEDHLAASVGEGKGSLSRNDPKVKKSFERNVLLGLQADAAGAISSYGMFMPDPEITKLP